MIIFLGKDENHDTESSALEPIISKQSQSSKLKRKSAPSKTLKSTQEGFFEYTSGPLVGKQEDVKKPKLESPFSRSVLDVNSCIVVPNSKQTMMNGKEPPLASKSSRERSLASLLKKKFSKNLKNETPSVRVNPVVKITAHAPSMKGSPSMKDMPTMGKTARDFNHNSFVKGTSLYSGKTDHDDTVQVIMSQDSPTFTQKHNTVLWCSVCNKDVSRHRCSHVPPEKAFQCPDCGRSFQNRSHLKRHGLIHTGEKPWQCEMCGKRFTRKSHLKRHELIHSESKPYS